MSPGPGQAEQLADGARLTRLAVAATYALLVFEFLTICDREYLVVYKSRWTLMKCLHLACRFCPLLLWPVIMYSLIWDHDMDSCKRMVIINAVIFLLFGTIPHSIYILRAYAFTGATNVSLAICLSSYCGYVFVVFWFSFERLGVYEEAFSVLGRTGCFRNFPHRYNNYSPIVFASIALDCVIGGMVAIHCVKLKIQHTRLGRLITTQGLLYYPTMLMLNVIGAVGSSIGSFRGYDLIVFTPALVVSAMLACRFVIQIREYALQQADVIQLTDLVRRDLEVDVDRSRNKSWFLIPIS